LEPWSNTQNATPVEAFIVLLKEMFDGDCFSCLYSDPGANDPILLQGAQRDFLGALGCWPDAGDGTQWYAGSALISLCRLRSRLRKYIM